MTTATRSNAKEIPALIELLESEGVDTFSVERFIPEGRGSGMAGDVLTPVELKDVFESMHRARGVPRRMHLLMYRPLACLLDPSDPTVGAMCSIGTNALTVLHDGTIFPCRRLPIPIGNVLSQGVFRTWYQSSLLWEVRNPANLKGKCAQCDLLAACRGCRAAAYVRTGDYLAEDPQCWK